ncbi:MAG: hypothetical protein QW544_04200 [Candidatus Caldarchaeum sp.]
MRDEKHRFRDHDFIETDEGWIFGVVSDTHPLGRVLVYPKYVPGDGVWSRDGISYRRVLAAYTSHEVAQALEMVRRLKPHYIYHDPVTDEDFTYIPVENIKKHYRCDERLQLILRKPANKLEEKCAKLVRRISSTAGVDGMFFGVSGSLLLQLHNPAADIDLVVYGGENFRKAVKASRQTQTPHDVKQTQNMTVKNYMTKYPITAEDAEKLAARCWTRGVFEGVFYSLHAVRLLEEIRAEYGTRLYKPVGVKKTSLRVLDASEGVFTPAVYQVEDLEGEVETLLCYDTTFAGLFNEGDVVEAVGKLEKVEDLAKGVTYYSLLVGSVKTANMEYVRLLKTL